MSKIMGEVRKKVKEIAKVIIRPLEIKKYAVKEELGFKSSETFSFFII